MFYQHMLWQIVFHYLIIACKRKRLDFQTVQAALKNYETSAERKADRREGGDKAVKAKEQQIMQTVPAMKDALNAFAASDARYMFVRDGAEVLILDAILNEGQATTAVPDMIAIPSYEKDGEEIYEDVTESNACESIKIGIKRINTLRAQANQQPIAIVTYGAPPPARGEGISGIPTIQLREWDNYKTDKLVGTRESGKKMLVIGKKKDAVRDLLARTSIGNGKVIDAIPAQSSMGEIPATPQTAQLQPQAV